ncbi:hypothetical protein [Virgisporangium aurantiacum]|uniref:Uncharacterized protein n=1 Tax=Virgisporangium aurantiacum TaxID=175570 RepID=A0A8J3Z8F0_9ACTN|nr:hypothetical protein [Virgisporangium aurantiacum]GIJ57210.1 hypothetical protein Vau01_047260 [Virgisporangium aurantiacum]
MYEAHTGSIVVTRDGIQAAFAEQFRQSYELRCDRLNIVPSDQGSVGFEAD